jgi:archaemetzincin
MFPVVPSRRQVLAGLVALAGCRGPSTVDAGAGAGAGAEGNGPRDAAPGAKPQPPASASASASAQQADTSSARLDTLKAARERLRPLHQRLGPPNPGEWRADHPEAGQTFEQYLGSSPVTPDAVRNVLVIQPLGALSPAQRKVVGLAADYMARYFNLETRILPDVAATAIPARARRTHPKWGDKQVLTTYVLEELLRPNLPTDAVAMIAFTASDLWPGGNWNFVFGEATLRDRVGVWSIYRNGDPGASPAAFKLALLRTLRIAVHETGHMLSLLHCTAYRCVQGGVNSRDEDDRAPLWACPECMVKIAWATRADPRGRYEKLAAFCKAQGLDAEAAFFSRSIAALG